MYTSCGQAGKSISHRCATIFVRAVTQLERSKHKAKLTEDSECNIFKSLHPTTLETKQPQRKYIISSLLKKKEKRKKEITLQFKCVHLKRPF